MKLGADNKYKSIGAVLLFVVAIGLFVRMLIGDSAPASAAAPSPTTATPSATRVRQPVRRVRNNEHAKTSTSVGASTLDPRLRLDLLKEVETTQYDGAGRNIFRADEVVKMPEPKFPARDVPVIAQTPPPVNPGPPPPPPINLKFFGFSNQSGEKKAFLSQGEDVFVAREGEIVNRRYRVVKINPSSVEIQDVLSNNQQTIPLTPGTPS